MYQADAYDWLRNNFDENVAASDFAYTLGDLPDFDFGQDRAAEDAFLYDTNALQRAYEISAYGPDGLDQLYDFKDSRFLSAVPGEGGNFENPNDIISRAAGLGDTASQDAEWLAATKAQEAQDAQNAEAQKEANALEEKRLEAVEKERLIEQENRNDQGIADFTAQVGKTPAELNFGGYYDDDGNLVTALQEAEDWWYERDSVDSDILVNQVIVEAMRTLRDRILKESQDSRMRNAGGDIGVDLELKYRLINGFDLETGKQSEAEGAVVINPNETGQVGVANRRLWDIIELDYD